MTRVNRITAAIFLAMAILLLAFHGNRVVATNDEGILLDSAQRISQGSRPYVDFWAYMSPGSYWLQAVVFRVFGISLLTGRLIVIVDFSLQCALVFWLTARLASLASATAVLFAFAGFQIADPSVLTAQHRWDSSTLALLGVALAISASASSRFEGKKWTFWLQWIASGALLAAAAWCTPTVAMVGGAVALWMVVSRDRRGALAPFFAGVALITALAVGWLTAKGCLIPFVEQMVWLRSNYLDVNAMPYGAIIGGYRALFEGSSGWGELAVRAVLVFCVALPAILPPLGLLGSAILLWRSKVPQELRGTIQLLLLAGAAFVMTLFPRADVMHLAFVAALPYTLAGAALARLIPVRARVAAASCTLALAGIFAANFFTTLRGTLRVSSPVGNLRVAGSESPAMEKLFALVRPGHSLFVYPYMPIHYFFTQGKNPTGFAFFSPGMGTPREESAALADLEARPPEWVLYLKLSREEFLRVCPRGAAAWRNERIEAWLEKNYRPADHPHVTVTGYTLLQHTLEEAGEEARAVKFEPNDAPNGTKQ
jgi:hypothetical protein